MQDARDIVKMVVLEGTEEKYKYIFPKIVIILTHLMKFKYEPTEQLKNLKSWINSIERSRKDLIYKNKLINRNTATRITDMNDLDNVRKLTKAYEDAKSEVIKQASIPLVINEQFADSEYFNIKNILDCNWIDSYIRRYASDRRVIDDYEMFHMQKLFSTPNSEYLA